MKLIGLCVIAADFDNRQTLNWPNAEVNEWVLKQLVRMSAVSMLCVLYVYRASYTQSLIFFLIVLLVTIIGLAMHALYAQCDPLVSKMITSSDQVICILGSRVFRFLA